MVFMPPVPVKLGTACASFYRQLRPGPAEMPRNGTGGDAARAEVLIPGGRAAELELPIVPML